MKEKLPENVTRTLEESLALIDDFFDLVDAANLSEDEMDQLNEENGLADRRSDLEKRISKIIDSSNKAKEKNK